MYLSIPREVAHHLGYYVYLYIDPRNGRPFYVGKGKGDRALDHLMAEGESRKAQKLGELRLVNCEPRIDILAHHDVLFTLGVACFHEDRFQRVIESPEELIPESRPSAILGQSKNHGRFFPGPFLGRSHERTEKSGFPFITLHVIKNVSGLPIFHPVIHGGIAARLQIPADFLIDFNEHAFFFQ